MDRARALLTDHRGVTIAVVIGATLLIALAAYLAVMRFGDIGPVADASPSSSVSTEPSAVPARSPDASVTPVAEPSAPAEVAYGDVFAATVLVNDLNVREAPVTGAALAALQAGDVVRTTGGIQTVDGVEWYNVQADTEIYGWVSYGPADDPYLELHRFIAQQEPARIEGLAAGSDGYLAWGQQPGVMFETRERFVAVSAEGATWELGQLPPETNAAGELSIEHGPAGWLLVASNEDNSETAGMWLSTEGLTWQATDTPFPPGIRLQVADADSPWHYVLASHEDGGGTVTGTVYLSTNGVEWEAQVLGEAYNLQATRLGESTLLWSERPEPGTAVWISTDDGSWHDVTDGGRYPGPVGSSPVLSWAGDHIVALTHDVASQGQVMVWTADVPGLDPETLVREWVRQPAAEEMLRTAGISHVVSRDGVTLVYGTAYETGELLAWSTTDGSTWEPLALSGVDDKFGHIAAGPSGFVGTGRVLSPAGWNPRFSQSTDGAAWSAESAPVIPVVEHAVIGACPAAPTTMVEWMAIPGGVGAECFGDTPVTFRAWSTVGGGCGGFAPGIFDPAWLASPFATYPLILEPDEVEYGGCGSAAADPTLTDLPAAQQWVEVAGHWADPASASCRHLPDPAYGDMGGGAGSLEFECRQRFVATEVRPVSGP